MTTNKINAKATDMDRQSTALAILSGDWSSFPGCEYYEVADWQSAAQYAVDSGDWTEWERMLAMEAAYEQYGKYAARVKMTARTWRDQPLDFKTWLSDYGPRGLA